MSKKYRYLELADPAESGNLKVAFSSETPVLRTGDGVDHKKGEKYWEILDHDRNHADISILKNRGAFLDEHDFKSQIGVIESAEICDDKMGRAEISFCDDTKSKDRSIQLRSKKRPHISFGYIQSRVLSETVGSDGIPVKRFAWQAYEISSVAVPADANVGVGRSFDPEKIDFDKLTSADISALTTEQKQRMKLLLDPNPPAGGNGNATIDETKVRSNAVSAERTRVKEITTAADVLIKDRPDMADKIRSIVNECLADETPVIQFQNRAMKEILGAKPVEPVTMQAIGMSEKERNAYSVLRGIQSCLKRNAMVPDGLEGEVHKELQSRASAGGLSFEGFAVPHDANVRCKPDRRSHTRDLNVSVFGQGGATVQTSIVTPIIEILRNRMVTDKLGITTMAGLSGNVAIPRQTGAATAYSLAESATLTKSTQALDQILLAPHRVGATNDYTRQLLLQSSTDVENFIRDDLMKVIAIKWDALILNGQGAGSEPLGILNTPGIGSVVFGATATYAKVVAFETALATLNADGGNMAYAVTPAVRGAWKTIAAALSGATAVINGAANAIWAPSGTPGEGEVNGYRAIASNQIPNNICIFGNWSEAVHGLYGGYDVIVNPYSRDVDAAVRITINTFGDVAIRHAASFCASADAGNQ